MMAFDRGTLRKSNPFRLASFIRKQLQRIMGHYESGRAAEYRERLMIRLWAAVALDRKSLLSRHESNGSIIKLIMKFMTPGCAGAQRLSDGSAFVVRMCIVLIDYLRMPFSKRGAIRTFYPVIKNGLNSNYNINKCTL